MIALKPRSRSLHNVTMLAGGEVLTRMVAFAATATLAARLGPAGFGIIGFGLAIASYLAIAVDSGLNIVGIREVAIAPHRARDLYLTVGLTRLMLAAAAFAILAAVTWMLPKPAVVKGVIILTGLSFFALAIDPGWVLKGLERPGRAAAMLVGAQAVYAAGVLMFVRGPSDILRVPAIQFAADAVAAVAFGAALVGARRLHISVAEGLRILRSAGYVGVSRVMRVVISTFDVVLLGFLATTVQVGLYTAAYRIIFFMLALVGVFTNAFLPAYARAAAEGHHALGETIGTAVNAGAVVGAPLVVGTVLVAAPLMKLVFGPAFIDGAIALQLLSVATAFTFMHWTVMNLLTVTNRTSVQAGIQMAAAAINVALNVWLIPRYGITGAAAATLVSEGGVVAASAVVLWRMRLLPSAGCVVRPVLASAVMAAAVILGAGHLLLLRIALGGVVYVIALAAIGGLPPEARALMAWRATP
jgi:O-antigen/teichoic acid export membrane protein